MIVAISCASRRGDRPVALSVLLFTTVIFKETTMSDPSGCLWAILAVLGVGGLALAIAYGSALWSQRRKDSIAKQAQDEAVRENYRQEEIREKRHES